MTDVVNSAKTPSFDGPWLFDGVGPGVIDPDTIVLEGNVFATRLAAAACGGEEFQLVIDEYDCRRQQGRQHSDGQDR